MSKHHVPLPQSFTQPDPVLARLQRCEQELAQARQQAAIMGAILAVAVGRLPAEAADEIDPPAFTVQVTELPLSAGIELKQDGETLRLWIRKGEEPRKVVLA